MKTASAWNGPATFGIAIDRMDNAAFSENAAAEVARILYGIADKLIGADGPVPESGRCVDVNGNHVGDWSVTPSI